MRETARGNRLEQNMAGASYRAAPFRRRRSRWKSHLAARATRRSLRKGGPTGTSTRAGAPPVGGQPGADPVAQVWMLGRPRQHGAGYAEIVVLPGQALVEDARLANLDLNIHELLISPHTHRAVDDADPVGLHFGLEKLEEISGQWCRSGSKHGRRAAAPDSCRRHCG
jgi:hypothetical protein